MKQITDRRIAGRAPLTLALALATLLLAGCSGEPPRFKLDFDGPIGLREADEKQKTELVNGLVAAFGEPDRPYVFTETGLDLRLIEQSAGPAHANSLGQMVGLYRRHCVHCHGTSGDGNGPTAVFLHPYPRDFRPGKFKFKSTFGAAKPTDADLHRILRDGVPGTAMPSFLLLPQAERDSLVEYVKYLSMRGETESFLRSALMNEEIESPITRDDLVANVELAANKWAAVQGEEAVVIPPPPPEKPLEESIALGKKLFQDPLRATCVKCHGPTGLGDGGDKLYDDWNTMKVKPAGNEHLYALPPQEIKPRNLRLGIFRGGRRPVDIYRRIFAGINGAGMPNFGAGPGEDPAKKLSADEIWALVDYVRSLPHEPSSQGQHEVTAHREIN